METFISSRILVVTVGGYQRDTFIFLDFFYLKKPFINIFNLNNFTLCARAKINQLYFTFLI